MKVIEVVNAAIDLTQVVAVSDIKIQDFKFDRSRTYYFEVYLKTGATLTLTHKYTSQETLTREHIKLIEAFKKINKG